uniref:Clp, N terminal n=2 Tax=unclassified Mycobacterium TaxID=2642494 RepID=A0A5Q5BF72_MYCSS
MFERFSGPARTAVTLAHEEARAMRADDIRPEHLLVGVLRSAGPSLSRVLNGHALTAEDVRERLAAASTGEFDDDASALREIGIDLYAVRDIADRRFGVGAFDSAGRAPRRRRRLGTPLVKPAKKALELALREALAHRDSVIGCEHLLLGILRGGDEVAVGLITERVDAAWLRADIVALLDRAA